MTAILPRVVGLAKATELLMFGRRISGDDAVGLRLAMAAVPEEELKAYVRSVGTSCRRRARCRWLS